MAVPKRLQGSLPLDYASSHWFGYAEPEETALKESALKKVVTAGNLRAKTGQINRRLDPETYARLVRNRSQARGDLAAAEGHHFALTRVLDRALTEGSE